LSPSTESKLKEIAAGGSASSGTGAVSDDTKVSTLVSDPADRAQLEKEWIFTVADVKRLQPQDWDQLRLSAATERRLKALLSSSMPYTESTPVKDVISNSADLTELDRQWVFTLADVKRMSPADWKSIVISHDSEQKLKIAASKIDAIQNTSETVSRGLADGSRRSSTSSDEKSGLKTAVKRFVSNKKDLKILKKEWIFTLTDVSRLRKEDWKELKVSPQTEASLKTALLNFTQKRNKISLDFKVGKEQRQLLVIKARIRQLDIAIQEAHKLAIKSEIKAIKAADNLCKLSIRKRQLNKLRHRK